MLFPFVYRLFASAIGCVVVITIFSIVESCNNVGELFTFYFSPFLSCSCDCFAIPMLFLFIYKFCNLNGDIMIILQLLTLLQASSMTCFKWVPPCKSQNIYNMKCVNVNVKTLLCLCKWFTLTRFYMSYKTIIYIYMHNIRNNIDNVSYFVAFTLL
jgi:hypothetical protein